MDTLDGLRERVPACTARCGAYGLVEEEQVLQFAAVTLLLGDHFDSEPEHAWAHEVLSDSGLSAEERGALLVALAELWVEERDA
jgi:hypothetical protein